MSVNKLTPLKNLQRQKIRLQVKSDALVDVLEENFEYLQTNIGSLVVDSTMETITSKMPPFVQNLLGKGEASPSSLKAEGFVDKTLDILPFFMKGGKVIIVSFLLKKLKKLIFKK